MSMTCESPDLIQLTRGFREARIVLSGLELGVFDSLLEGGKTAKDFAASRDLDPRAAEILLDALASLGVLSKAKDHYTIAPRHLPALDPDSPRCVVPSLMHTLNLWRRWADLTEVVRRGHPLPTEGRTVSETEHFIGAMRVGARQRASALAARLDLKGVKTLLDLGGGPGSYAIAFAKQKPDLKATVFDLMAVADIAARHVAEEDLSDRVGTLAGNYLSDPVGGPYDLVWMSSIVHMHTPEQNRMLIRKAAQALKRGGRIIVRDFLLDEDGAGPASAAIFAVNMLVATEGGRSYKASEIRGWMKDAGITRVEVQTLDDDGLVIGRKGSSGRQRQP
jgi:SAM-dependent methyltransferase